MNTTTVPPHSMSAIPTVRVVDETFRFEYPPLCSVPDCGRLALYKAGATWSDGSQRELKHYGLACRLHRDDLMARAAASRRALRVSEGEYVGPVVLRRLVAGLRDAELPIAEEDDPLDLNPAPPKTTRDLDQAEREGDSKT
ncbi:hypothetical protein Isop_0263 [Isosphaera pallida ATCC 43644]|uniref:Uncharacterized protein n=2 Tax=Isosphaera pallida TaxID=128 RepID=E8QX27_ISOPI|nr:hypothetical protein Isop_0263 [Isosphaera pallida ATCC 43644]